MYCIILSDSLDDSLGAFFEKCSEAVVADINDMAKKTLYLKGERLDDVALSIHIQGREDSVTLLLSYCHGDSKGLYFGNGRILMDVDSHLISSFSGSIIYSLSCSSGEIFGPKLIENGAKCFIGYKGEVIILLDYIDDFSVCSNAGILQLLAGSNAEIAYKAIKHQFNKLMSQLSFLDQSIINDNMDKLILIGDRNVKLINK